MLDQDLGGTWRAAIADEGLRRGFAEPRLGDERWETIAVPGHWRSTPAFADTDGPLLYRRRFETEPPAEGERVWLVLDGLFYMGDVWLDGEYLGATEGYFVRHTFEVTEAVRARSEHLLAVEVTCARPEDRTAKRNLTGVFQHWDCFDPDWNPGGIWRGVRLERTGAVRVRSLRVLCREANPDRAVLALRAELDSDAARTIRLATRLGGAEEVAERSLAAGPNAVEWSLTVPEPRLWWPAALGEPVLHDLAVEATTDDGGGGPGPSHTLRRRTGLRSLRFRHWVLSVNGERLFLKGTNQGPTRMALGEASPDELGRDVRLAQEAGLDLLRLHAHVSRPELYEAADEAGLLLWQDLPLQWGYARGLRSQAARQARAAVDQLGHHPSLAIWCGHNEPLALDIDAGSGSSRRALRRAMVGYLGGQQLPTWNKTVLDGSIKRALERADGTRPVIPHSGLLPHVGSGGTDTHVYFGWYHGEERQFPGFLRAFPRMARFVTEFGAQAVPETAGFMEPERWPDLPWAELERRAGLQRVIFDRRVPPSDFTRFEDWRRATQGYQAELLRSHVEALRRLKYRPTGGFCQFALADAADFPSVSWSVLDADRVPKAGYHALAAACRPVIVVADRLPARVRPGDSVALDVHVVSDLRTPVEAAVVDARVIWAGGDRRWRWEGDLPADSCVRVGAVELVVPDATGELTLDLSLRGRGVQAANRYTSVIGR